MKHRRLLVWGLVLCGAALLVALAPPAEDGTTSRQVVQSVDRAAPLAKDNDAWSDRSGQVLRIVQRVPEQGDPDGRLWGGEQATPRAAVAAPNATITPMPVAEESAAPVLPFRLLGRYAEGNKEGVVVVGADGSVMLAHVGEKLGSDYQVESVSGNVMVLNYLPLDKKQTMDIGIAK